jgi:hypothetical protein
LRGRHKFADEEGRGILASFLREALGQAGDGAFGEIEFEALDAVHGEEHDSGGEGLAIADLADEIVERRKVDAAEAEASGGEMKDGAPDFFARIGEGGDDDGSGMEGRSRLWRLIEAGRGHDGIVLFKGRGRQMGRWWRGQRA